MLTVCAWLIVVIWAIVFAIATSYHASVASPPSISEGALFLQQQQQQQHMILQDGHHEKLQAKLESAQRRVQELEQNIQNQQQQQQVEEPALLGAVCPQPTIAQSPILKSINPVCRALPQPIPHAAALWTHYLAEIHKASQIPNDHRYYFHDFTAQLLHLVSPRLPHSIKTLPKDGPSGQWAKLEEILQLAHRRYDYVTNPHAWQGRTPPREVRVLVMGGSLLVGMNCRRLVKELGFQLRLPLSDCSWANRLEKLLNQFLLGKQLKQNSDQELIVHVDKVAMGGTNTETGTAILEYDLLPSEAKHPDIVINAYATNDMHILTMNEARAGNITLRDKIFDMVQGFVRRVMSPETHQQDACGGGSDQSSSSWLSPLLVHLDDYLGNEQREIWATTELSQGVQVLANYYGFASASYADVVRDFVYGDTREYWFSPQGWYEDNAADSESEMTREIHPNMGMHIVAAWVMGYNFLNMITNFCSLEGFNLHTHANKNKNSRRMDYNATRLTPQLLPELNGKYWPPGKPKGPPNGLPPRLDQSLSLERVTRLWRDADNEQQQQQRRQQEEASQSVVNCEEPQAHQQAEYVRCPFSWLSGISSEQKKASVAESFFKDHMSFQGDWSFVNDHGKLGIVPAAPMSGLAMEMSRVSQPIRKITIFYMKSYGAKWARSETRVQILRKQSSPQNTGESVAADANWDQLEERSILGYHNKETSETYTESFELSTDPIDAGASLKVKLVLMGGTTFKIMGVAFCS